MKRIVLFLILGAFLTACSGTSSVVKKSWSNNENSLSIIDLTRQDDKLMDAGAHLHRALEDTLLATNFVLSDDSARYKLKYKIEEYVEGSRVKRFLAIGALSKVGQAKLRVQAALFKENKLVGHWEVESWLKDGLLGGSDKTMFQKAANEITNHLKGD